MRKRDSHPTDDAMEAFLQGLAARKAPEGARRPCVWVIADWIERNAGLIGVLAVFAPVTAATVWCYGQFGQGPIVLLADWIFDR